MILRSSITVQPVQQVQGR